MFIFKSETVLKLSFAGCLLLFCSGCALVNRMESVFSSDDAGEELQQARDTNSRLQRSAQATKQSRRDLAGDPDLDEIAKELEKIEERRKSVRNYTEVATGNATAIEGEVQSAVKEMKQTESLKTAASETISSETAEKPVLDEAKEASKNTVESAKSSASNAFAKVKSLLGVGSDEKPVEKVEEVVEEKAENQLAKVEEATDSLKENAEQSKEQLLLKPEQEISQVEKTLETAKEEAKEDVNEKMAEGSEAIAKLTNDEAEPEADKLAKALDEAEEILEVEQKNEEAASEEEELAKSLAAESADARARLADTSLADVQVGQIENAISDAVPDGEGAVSQTKIPVWVFLLMAAALSIAGFGLLWVSRNT